MSSASSSKSIRVVVVDDHPVVAAGVRALLGDYPELEVVGLAASGREALEQCSTLRPDVLLLDLRLPDVSGAEVCRRVKSESASIRVVILTSYGDDAHVLTALASGADGYLLKHAAGTNIGESLVKVARGEQVLDSAVAGVVMREALGQGQGQAGAGVLGPLNDADHSVLRRVAEGWMNKEIAFEMGVAEKTIRNQMTRIFAKMGVTSRTEAALLYERARLQREVRD